MNGTTMSSNLPNRLRTHINQLKQQRFSNKAASISVQSTDETSWIAPIEVRICMHESYYKGSHLVFYINLPQDYANYDQMVILSEYGLSTYVEIWACQPIWHPNIDQKSGKMSLGTRETRDLVSVVKMIQMLLLNPDKYDQINISASSMLWRSDQEFQSVVRQTLDGVRLDDNIGEIFYSSMRDLYCPNCVVPQSYIHDSGVSDYIQTSAVRRGSEYGSGLCGSEPMYCNSMQVSSSAVCSNNTLMALELSHTQYHSLFGLGLGLTSSLTSSSSLSTAHAIDGRGDCAAIKRSAFEKDRRSLRPSSSHLSAALNPMSSKAAAGSSLYETLCSHRNATNCASISYNESCISNSNNNSRSSSSNNNNYYNRSIMSDSADNSYKESKFDDGFDRCKFVKNKFFKADLDLKSFTFTEIDSPPSVATNYGESNNNSSGNSGVGVFIVSSYSMDQELCGGYP